MRWTRVVPEDWRIFGGEVNQTKTWESDENQKNAADPIGPRIVIMPAKYHLGFPSAAGVHSFAYGDPMTDG